MEEKTDFEVPKVDYKSIVEFVTKYPVLLIGGGLIIVAIGLAIKLFTPKDNKVVNLRK